MANNKTTSSEPVRLQLYNREDHPTPTPMVWATAKESEGKANKREK